MATLWKILTRKKVIDPARAEESSLARVLNTFDLTALGVGSTLGVGMYVLVGKVAKETAGPSVILSFFIAAVASTFAALCYAEFGARAPRAGSAYIYSYVCVGEFIAFVIGWNLILEYVIGSASVARGMSLYIDALMNNTMKNAFIDIAPINIPYLSAYFDFLTFAITVVLACGLAFGMKESSRLNNVITTLNILVVLFVIIAGSTKADIKNWEIEVPKNVTDAGSGGFFPFGIAGMLKGAATCFYGFVGFDCIATTGEEVKNPQRAIPIAIIVSLLVVFLAYFGTATVVTLMIPYYLQDINSPIPHAFEEFGWEAAKWIVTLGGICALFASLFGALFPLPRILYAMATDGLIFKFLGTVNSRFSTPVIGTLCAGLLTGLMGAMFEQDQLINMMSIGTLLAYTIVAASILLLRYSVDEEGYSLAHSDSGSSVSTYTDSRDLIPSGNSDEYIDECAQPVEEDYSFLGLLKQCVNYRRFGRPTRTSEKLVTINVCTYCLLCLLLGLCLIYLVDDIAHGEIHAIVITSVLGLLMILTLMSIGTQPESKKPLTFKVPLVPLVPALSILINIYLMLCLDITTWIRFGVWMAIGLPIYFSSAHCYSKEVSQPALKASTPLGNSNSYINFGYIHEGSKRGSYNSDSAYFEDDSTVEKEEKNDVIHDILANLDNILERESRQTKFISRKMSVDTVSNVSNTVLEENIVAIVHREDEPIIEEAEELNIPSVCCIEGGFEEEVTSLDSFKMVAGRISDQKSEVQMKSSDEIKSTVDKIEIDKIEIDKNNMDDHIISNNKPKIIENEINVESTKNENEEGFNKIENIENNLKDPDCSHVDNELFSLVKNKENGEMEDINGPTTRNDSESIKFWTDCPLIAENIDDKMGDAAKINVQENPVDDAKSIQIDNLPQTDSLEGIHINPANQSNSGDSFSQNFSTGDTSDYEDNKNKSNDFVTKLAIPTTLNISNPQNELDMSENELGTLENPKIQNRTQDITKTEDASLDIPKPLVLESPVTPEAVKRLDEILNAEEMSFIPIPPSMADFEKSKTLKIPRLQSTRVKLPKKNPPVIPPADYEAEKEEEITVDIVKIGSKEHANLKKKLDAILFKKSSGVPQPNKLTKPEVVEVEAEEAGVNIRKKSITSIMDRIISEIPSKHDTVDEIESPVEVNPPKNDEDVEPTQEDAQVGSTKDDEIEPELEDIRSKLNKLFANDVATRRAPKKISATISNITQELLKKEEAVEKGGSKTLPRGKPEQEDHKRLMMATLNSIKLRKLGGVDDS